MGKNIKNLNGHQFGRLTVVSFNSSDGKGNVKWDCKCICGNTTICTRRSLEGSHSKSCGCLKKEKIKITQELTKLPPFVASANALYSSYLRSAKSRNYDFNLSKEYFLNITQQNCYYCGEPPKNKFKRKDYNGSYIYNGIDRKDNSKGYIEGNCLPCCFTCNKAKNTISYDEFILWIQKLINFHKQI